MVAYIEKIYFQIPAELHNEKGQTLTEYALLLLLIAIVVALVLPDMSTVLSNSYASVVAAFPP